MSENENSENGGDAVAEGRSQSRQRQRAQQQQDSAPQQNDAASQDARGDGGESGGGGQQPQHNQHGGGQQQQGQGQGQGQGRRGRRDRRGNRHQQYQQNFQQNDDEYDESKNGGGNGPLIDLNDLKRKSAADLLALAEELGIQEGVARARKQDIVFLILKAHARAGGGIYGEGVLEILQDGFGFLRGPDESYLAGPDDIYVSPSQIRRFNLRTGDYITGRIRPPKEGERYFALLKVDNINSEPPEASKNKVLFENLTPLFPRKAFHLERGNGSSEDITGRILDLIAPIGKGQR
ncbi:MAG TPA: Rho termination factor N-terminal domain-containing protein, partial [Rhodanobacteraceae bacterium]|nr:Rho termination factor N-terminal domain-containing protein [Rhodanobacteraceae bacterium]